MISISGIFDRIVPPGRWEDESFTTSYSGQYYAGATAITKVWSESAGCSTQRNADRIFRDLNPDVDCRSYCADRGVNWPDVVDCRIEMGHSYSLSVTYPIFMDFYDSHSV